MNLAELAEHSLQRLGERMRLVFEGQRYTNAQLMDWARRLHRGFARLGLRRGEIGLLYIGNHPIVNAVFQGIFRTGGTALPVMFLWTASEIRFVLTDCRAQGIITDQMNLPKVREAAQGLDFIRWIVVHGGPDNPGASIPEYSLEEMMAGDSENSIPNIDEGDVALMMYTAGTTGKPKGVMLSHANLYASAEAATQAAELHKFETIRIAIHAMPMAHIFGVGVMNAGYMMPERIADSYGVQMAWFEPEEFMRLIQEHRCNTMAAVPTMLIFILNHPSIDKYDLSSLEDVICGAAPLPVEIARTFQEKFGCRVREIYGQTESTGMGSANSLLLPYKPGSAGKAYFNTKLAIFDDNDRPLPPGERGEIVLQGPTIMKGYYNRPEETAEVLKNGWLHTGDVGYLDEDGYLYIVDRKRDMIIRGGENIFPAELEEILYTHQGVAEGAIVGAPDPVYGEKIIAFVVTKPDANPSEREIIDYFKDKTSSFKAPEKVFFIDSLPKSLVGKILRRELRERAARGAN
jgi:long-chain acyl-CoA synthetase